MPNDHIADPAGYHQNWDIVKGAINGAQRQTQAGEDVWCVISFDGVYMGTIWSEPRRNDGPTNHAEDRFFRLYSLPMLNEYSVKFGRLPDILRLSVKYSPCNKRNDKRDDRCTIKITEEKSFWPTIQVRYKRPYTNPAHNMAQAHDLLNHGGISSGLMH